MVRRGCLYLSVVLSLSATGCATPSNSNTDETGSGVYYNSALSNQDPAPASMSPPSEAPGSTPLIDEVHLRASADYHFSLGEAYSLEGNSQKAIEEFRLALVYDAKSALIHMRLAAEFIKSGLVSEAVEQARVAVEKEPDNKDAHLLMGGLFSALRLYDNALKEYEEILRISPEDEQAPLYIGAIYAEQREFAKAQTYFQELAKRKDYPNRHLAYYYLGRAYLEVDPEDKAGKAEKVFLSALQLKPGFEEVTLALGRVYANSKKEAKALALWASYQKAHGPSAKIAEVLAQLYVQRRDLHNAYREFEVVAARRPGDLTVQYRMALILVEEKRYTEARDLLQAILEQEPASDRVRFYLGAVYEELKDYENAVETLLKIPIRSSYYQDAIIHSAYLSKLLNKPTQAVSIIERGIAARPDILQFYSFHTSLLDEQKRYKEALEVLVQAVTRFPDQPELHFYLGSMYDRLGDRDSTIKFMRKVLSLDTNHIQALNYLAYTYAEQNINLDEAEEMVRRALQLQPNDGYIMDTLGWVLHKKGQHGEAVKVLEAAYRSQSGESIIAEHLGDAYFSYQLFEKARQMYVRAAESGAEPQTLAKLRSKIAGIDQMGGRGAGQRLPASSSSGK